jgi:hypothetical protein
MYNQGSHRLMTLRVVRVAFFCLLEVIQTYIYLYIMLLSFVLLVQPVSHITTFTSNHIIEMTKLLGPKSTLIIVGLSR